MRVEASLIPLAAVAAIAMARKAGNQRESDTMEGAAADANSLF